MLSHEIPNLKLDKITAKDRLKHFKSDLLKSKQYDLYDLVIVNNYKQTAGYVCKYLMKQQKLKDSDIYVNFSTKNEKLIFQKLINDIKLDIKDIKKQAPFIKKSQKLGIFNTLNENIENVTLTPYYLNKYWKQFIFNKKDKDINISDLEFYSLLKKQFIFKDKKNMSLWFQTFKRKFKNDIYNNMKNIFNKFIDFIDLHYNYFQEKENKYLEKVEKYKRELFQIKKSVPKLKDVQYNYISKDFF